MDQDIPYENNPIDLVGGPFAVLESDPGLFSILTRKLGAPGIEVVEVYDIAPWAVEHLNPRGLILCYPCDEAEQADEIDPATDVEDLDAQDVWFANQVSNDACASQALLNVILNFDSIEMAVSLRKFRSDTENMSPLMRGLAATNCGFIREAHNSMARPADIRGALHSAAASTLEYAKSTRSTHNGAPPTKRRKRDAASPKKSKSASSTKNLQDTYHFVGYVPVQGKVWELDGLRASGPLEVGEFCQLDPAGSVDREWVNIARPAIKRKMERALAKQGDELRYTLLAVVDDRFQIASDSLEMLKRERTQLERRLNHEYPDGWHDKVDSDLVTSAEKVFITSTQGVAPGRIFSRDFAARRLENDIKILDMAARSLPVAWEGCMKAARPATTAVEDEISNNMRAHTEHVNRTYDYEPFLQSFISCVQHEGLLEPILASQQ